MTAISAVTTHVLDTARGTPAEGVAVRLELMSAAGYRQIGRSCTDADGRVRDLGPTQLEAGTYRLVFDTAGYFAGRAGAGHGPVFFPEVVVTFTVDGRQPHHHVPLLLSPFAYTTYRGS
jgi:5-hydroxyisourate hydrolase